MESLLTAILERGVKNRIIGLGGSFSWGSQAARKMAAKLAEKPVTLLSPTPQLKQANQAMVEAEVSQLASDMISALEN